MEKRRASHYCCLLLLAGLLAQVSCQLQISSTGANSQPFSNPDRITVGFASDLIVQVLCTSQNVSMSGSNIQWSYAVNGSEVDNGLRAFGTSQEGGVLRVYPANQLTGEGAMFQCSDGNTVLNVTFDLQDDLFFLNPIPPTASIFTNRSELCAVPDIPTANVTIVNESNPRTGNDYFYCRVETERGIFRSRSVISLPAPSLVYEPENITAQPVNVTVSAAFSCAISPADDLTEIQWFFDMMSFGSGSSSGSGSGMGLNPGLSSGMLSNDMEDVTIHQPSDPGTSILILDSVGNEHEGLYSCVAVFSDGTTITSSAAALIFDRTSLGDNDVIILAPPTTLLVTEGDIVSIPCVGSGGTAPTFTLGGAMQTSGPYSLDFASIATSDAGTYTCQVGETTANFTVNVSAMISRPSMENITIISGPPYSSEIVLISGTSITLRCPRTPRSALLRNGEVVESGISSTLTITSEGVYQCLGAQLAQAETDFTGELGSNVYILTQAVSTLDITPNISTFTFGQDEEAALNCSVSANPLPLLEWTKSGSPVNGTVQAVTGFNETAFSILMINITELGVGTHDFECSAAVDTPSTQSTSSLVMATITVQAVLQNISVFPEMQNFILESNTNDTVTLDCSIEANPGPPRIEWSSNGENITSQAGPVILVKGITYSSTLTLQLGELVPGENSITCFAFQDAETPPTVINDTAIINVNAAPNFTVNPQDLLAVVGDFISLTCSAQATPLPNITWEYSNGTTIMDEDLFNISSSFEVNVTTSVLSFIGVEDLVGFSMFRCVASNEFGEERSNNATVTIQSMPMFVVNPESTIVIVGDQVILTCSAEAIPTVPTVTWLDGDGVEIIDNQIFDISFDSPEDGYQNVSMLSFNATAAENRTGNGSMLQCMATVLLEPINRTLMNFSEVATITIAGVPGSPAPVTVNDSTSRTALASWQQPFSLIDITNYNVTVLELPSASPPGLTVADPMSFSVSNSTTVILTGMMLRPNRRYNVTVVAYNRAGSGERAMSNTFMTLEDVPEGSPNITSVSSTQLRQINLSWTEVEPDLRNGIITNYIIQYQIRNGDGNIRNKTVVGLTTTLTANDGIVAGVTYIITVAARTMIGPGPTSALAMQGTITQPIDISGGAQPITANTNAVTQNTIPITLPSIPGATPNNFSHFWVIAMKVDSAFANNIRQNATVRFSDNSSFTMYSDDIPVNVPYIVAEISASSLTLSTTTNFILGDEGNTEFLNDQPTLYRNGPLTQGTEYTAFLWGFPPNVAPGQVQKRQTSSLQRQYDVFSSSAFLVPVFTASPVTGLAGGVIAAIIIVLLTLCIALLTLIIVVMLYMRWRVKAVDLPPPNRKGSMRLRDRREVIQDSSTASLIKNQRAESELQQLTPDDVRLAVTVEEFPNYCKLMHANSDHLFSEEYEILTIKSPSLPHIQCSMPHNVHKNRYANINCYDESRVHLSVIPGMEGSDYINANYIDGYQRKCAFVATQGPLPNTTYDFWRMVWELNSSCVIMLTNLVEKSRAKCHQYWPEVGSLNLGDLTVTLIEVQQLAYYTIRTYRMSRGNDRREVKQFHYTGWPDFGVPDHPNPVISFIRRLANFKRTTDGPDIIHCSAGVGRTGTLVGIQSMMQMMNEEGKIDIFNFVLGMRRHRNYMVQTERQYIFLHDSILEIMKVGDTEIPIQSLRRRYKELQCQDPNTESSKMETEFAQLIELQSIDQSQFQAAKMTVNLPKNRFPDILPYERYRVRLLLHPGVSGSDYINASYIDGYQQRHQYIVTQGPLKDTVDDFWRMVWEHRASTIMMLCQLEEKGKEQCVRYWPNEKIRQHGDMFVELTQVTEFATYTMREFSITNTKINESRTIKQYQYTDWLEDQNPSNAAAIIDLIGVLQKSQHMNGGGPIIVHDSTSVGRAGTFCVLSSVLEQLKVEGIVDLFFTIHSLRQQQPGLVQSFEQYKFCYQAVMEFLDSFDHYANFD